MGDYSLCIIAYKAWHGLSITWCALVDNLTIRREGTDWLYVLGSPRFGQKNYFGHGGRKAHWNNKRTGLFGWLSRLSQPMKNCSSVRRCLSWRFRHRRCRFGRRRRMDRPRARERRGKGHRIGEKVERRTAKWDFKERSEKILTLLTSYADIIKHKLDGGSPDDIEPLSISLKPGAIQICAK